MNPVLTPISALSPPAPKSEREQLAGAAKQFEAIFVRQMLAAARKSSFGESMLGSEALGTFHQMQDDRFADIAAERGSFGLAKMIEAQLSARVGAGASSFDKLRMSSARADVVNFANSAQPELVEGRALTPARARNI